MCDLAQENVNGSHSNAEQNSKWMHDKRQDRLFETDSLDGWTAN